MVYTSRGFQPAGAWENVPGREFHFVGAMLAEDGHRDVSDDGRVGQRRQWRERTDECTAVSDAGGSDAAPANVTHAEGSGDDDCVGHASSHGSTLSGPSERSDDDGGGGDDDDAHSNAFVKRIALAAGSSTVVYVSMGTAVSTGAKFWRIVARAFPPGSGFHLVCSLGRFAEDEASASYVITAKLSEFPVSLCTRAVGICCPW